VVAISRVTAEPADFQEREEAETRLINNDFSEIRTKAHRKATNTE
jgi:hypothetical protein